MVGGRGGCESSDIQAFKISRWRGGAGGGEWGEGRGRGEEDGVGEEERGDEEEGKEECVC